jgi:hypothetical protein
MDLLTNILRRLKSPELLAAFPSDGGWCIRAVDLRKTSGQRLTSEPLSEAADLTSALREARQHSRARHVIVLSTEMATLVRAIDLPPQLEAHEQQEFLRWEASSGIEELAETLPSDLLSDPTQWLLGHSKIGRGYCGIVLTTRERKEQLVRECASAGTILVAYLSLASLGWANPVKAPTGLIRVENGRLHFSVARPEALTFHAVYPYTSGPLPRLFLRDWEAEALLAGTALGVDASTLAAALPAVAWTVIASEAQASWECEAFEHFLARPTLPLLATLPPSVPIWKKPVGAWAVMLVLLLLIATTQITKHRNATHESRERLQTILTTVKSTEERLQSQQTNAALIEAAQTEVDALEAQWRRQQRDRGPIRYAAHRKPGHAARILSALAHSFPGDPQLTHLHLDTSGSLRLSGTTQHDLPLQYSLHRFHERMEPWGLNPVHLTTAPDPNNPNQLIFSSEPPNFNTAVEDDADTENPLAGDAG